MPKTGTFFDDQMIVNCFADLKEKLVALAYLRGETSYAGMARDLLTRAVEKKIEGMDPHEKRQFTGVLENVRAQTAITRQKRAEKAAAHSTPPPQTD